MLNQLLDCLKDYAQKRQDDVNQGFYSSKFASNLVETYSSSMVKGLRLIGKDAHVNEILSESDVLCRTIYAQYRPKLRVIHTEKHPTPQYSTIRSQLAHRIEHHHARSGTTGW